MFNDVPNYKVIKEELPVCPKCGKQKRLVTGERRFSFDSCHICIVSGLDGLTECDCGIDLDDATHDLLQTIF